MAESLGAFLGSTWDLILIAVVAFLIWKVMGNKKDSE